MRSRLKKKLAKRNRPHVWDMSAGYETLGRLINYINTGIKPEPLTYTEQQKKRWAEYDRQQAMREDNFRTFKRAFILAGYKIVEEPSGERHFFDIPELGVQVYHEHNTYHKPHEVYFPTYGSRSFGTLKDFERLIRNKQNFSIPIPRQTNPPIAENLFLNAITK